MYEGSEALKRKWYLIPHVFSNKCLSIFTFDQGLVASERSHPLRAVLAQVVLPRCPAAFLCVSMSMSPVAGEEAPFIGDVDSSLGSAIGCSVLGEL